MICHHLLCSHPSLIHVAMSLLNWYKMACVVNILHRFIWMKFVSILFMYVHSGKHGHFHWRTFVILTQSPTVLKFVYITDAQKLWWKHVATWVFVAVSEKWQLRKSIWESNYYGWHAAHRTISVMLDRTWHYNIHYEKLHSGFRVELSWSHDLVDDSQKCRTNASAPINSKNHQKIFANWSANKLKHTSR